MLRSESETIAAGGHGHCSRLHSPPDALQAYYAMHDVRGLFDELLTSLHAAMPASPCDFLIAKLTEIKEKQKPAESCPLALPVKKYSASLEADELTIVVLGASGDLAKKKTFPALFTLFARGLLPQHAHIVGYARSPLELDEFKARISSKFNPKHACFKKAFLDRVDYVHGNYDSAEDLAKLNAKAKELEKNQVANRVFYLALPPTVFEAACKAIKASAVPAGWCRVVVEKPFGSDLESSNKMAKDIGAIFQESQLFRIDHYLGKEMVQNLVTMRFANKVFGALWNRSHISNVQITFKETIGTEGRGGYFDTFGIIRDVIQNHLTQILALIAMEKPHSLSAEHIRDEKVRVLNSVKPARLEDCVLGQYTAGNGEAGYTEDETVPKGSITPTFASIPLFIDNDRWDGVPFILKAGKALDTKKVVVRVQFRDEIEPFRGQAQRNEFVINAQPEEAIYLKVSTKEPGMSSNIMQTELDLSYQERFGDITLPDAYESLINEVVLGNVTNFVRSDELEAAWKIYTPMLHAQEAQRVVPKQYAAGSRGPPEADEMAARLGFVRSEGYEWKSPAVSPKL